jgi:hypothetical protein
MKTEIIIASCLGAASVVGFAFVIINGIKDAKRRKHNGPFKDR